jgi:hypothetical protein
MNIPTGSVISFTSTHPFNGDKYDLIGEYINTTTFGTRMTIIKVIEGPYIKRDGGQYFPIDVLSTAMILYPNVTAFYEENPEYLL